MILKGVTIVGRGVILYKMLTFFLRVFPFPKSKWGGLQENQSWDSGCPQPTQWSHNSRMGHCVVCASAQLRWEYVQRVWKMGIGDWNGMARQRGKASVAYAKIPPFVLRKTEESEFLLVLLDTEQSCGLYAEGTTGTRGCRMEMSPLMVGTLVWPMWIPRPSNYALCRPHRLFQKPHICIPQENQTH